MKKQRKSLDDALAEQFVYEESQPKQVVRQPTPAAPPSFDLPSTDKSKPLTASVETVLSPQQPSKELSLMEKLQLEPKEVTKRFTVDLPETMHRKLSILSARTGRTKADIVRMLLDETLSDVKD
jgi:hypothetical protein